MEFPLRTPENRVAVAKEVLGLLYEGRLIPNPQFYFMTGDGWGRIHLPAKNPYLSLAEFAETSRGVCVACGVGSVIVAIARLFNKVPDVLNHTFLGGFLQRHVYPYMELVFVPEQRAAIEVAFMATSTEYDILTDWGREILTEDQKLSAHSFGQVYPDPEERLTAIMQNIVDNKGEFVY